MKNRLWTGCRLAWAGLGPQIGYIYIHDAFSLLFIDFGT